MTVLSNGKQTLIPNEVYKALRGSSVIATNYNSEFFFRPAGDGSYTPEVFERVVGSQGQLACTVDTLIIVNEETELEVIGGIV